MRQVHSIKIRALARLVGTLESIKPATFIAPLHMRELQINLREALQS